MIATLHAKEWRTMDNKADTPVTMVLADKGKSAVGPPQKP